MDSKVYIDPSALEDAQEPTETDKLWGKRIQPSFVEFFVLLWSLALAFVNIPLAVLRTQEQQAAHDYHPGRIFLTLWLLLSLTILTALVNTILYIRATHEPPSSGRRPLAVRPLYALAYAVLFFAGWVVQLWWWASTDVFHSVPPREGGSTQPAHYSMHAAQLAFTALIVLTYVAYIAFSAIATFKSFTGRAAADLPGPVRKLWGPE